MPSQDSQALSFWVDDSGAPWLGSWRLDHHVPDVGARLSELLQVDAPRLVTTLNVDHVLNLRTDSQLRAAYELASVRFIDGTPLRWLCALLGVRGARRVAGADLPSLIGRSAAWAGRHVVFLGGKDETAQAAARSLNLRFPELRASSVAFPFVDDVADPRLAAVVDELATVNPDLVFICVGSPKQEAWFVQWRDLLPSAVYVGAGAVVDFEAGAARRAPRVLQTLGLEWAFRLAQEPRRLASRYLVKGPSILPIIFTSVGRRWRS